MELTPIEDDSVQPVASIFSNKKSEISVSLSKTSTLEPKANNATESMLSGMARALFLAQCLSLLGVSNVAGRDGSSPVFRWKSTRMLYCVVVSSLLAIRVILTLNFCFSRHRMTLGGIQVLTFYMSSFLTSCFFVRLAVRWTSLCAALENVEKRVSFYGNSCGLKRQMMRITAAVFLSALVEKILYEYSVVTSLKAHNTSDRYERDWFHIYYDSHYETVAAYVPYAPISIVGSILINLMALLISTYNDLFIMLISVAIASQFRILNNSLIATAHEDKDEISWRHARETYNHISLFVQTLDRSLSSHILLSFIINSVIVGLQLLHTISTDDCTCTLHEHIYLIYSFGILSLRAVGVCIFAASVYEESRVIKRVLFSVSSKSYSVEVERFIEQVTSDEVVLTGGRFFKVTRSFILRVIGTAITYGVVLVQINGLQPGSTSSHSH